MRDETNKKMEATFYTKETTFDEDEFETDVWMLLLKPITPLPNSEIQNYPSKTSNKLRNKTQPIAKSAKVLIIGTPNTQVKM